MLDICHDYQGRLHINVDRKDHHSHLVATQITIDLYHNLGFVQFGANTKWIPEKRLLSAGDKASAIVGDYKITVERVSASADKIIKLRKD